MRDMKTICGATLFVLLAPILLLAQLDADTDRENGRKLEGVWSIVVTTRNCATGAPGRTFPAMETYARGGTMIEFALGSATGPTLSGRTTGQGIWRYESNGFYSASFQLFRLDTAGAYIGTSKGVLEVSLSDDGNSFTSNETLQQFDLMGGVVTRCNTRAGTRFE